jgi:hypothetical protein
MSVLVIPRIEEKELYAIAIPTDGPMMVIQTYHNLEQLETGYRHWKEFASKQGLTKVYPIELLDDKGNCKILENLLKDRAP